MNRVGDRELVRPGRRPGCSGGAVRRIALISRAFDDVLSVTP